MIQKFEEVEPAPAFSKPEIIGGLDPFDANIRIFKNLNSHLCIRDKMMIESLAKESYNMALLQAIEILKTETIIHCSAIRQIEKFMKERR